MKPSSKSKKKNLLQTLYKKVYKNDYIISSNFNWAIPGVNTRKCVLYASKCLKMFSVVYVQIASDKIFISTLIGV